MNKDLTYEELQKQPDGAVVSMGCHKCEGFEKHKKIDGKWVCQCCGLLSD